MNGRGIKRPLSGTLTTSSFYPGRADTVERHQSRKNRENLSTYGSDSDLRWCCRCRRRWKDSALRLAGVVGIQVLGFMARACRGFTPPSASAGIIRDRPRPRDGHWEGVLLGADTGCRGRELRYSRAALGGMGAPPKGWGLWWRRRRRWPGDGEDVLSVGGNCLTSCCVARLSSTEGGRPLGLLYGGTLLADASNSRRDELSESVEPSATVTTEAVAVEVVAAMGARSEEEVDAVPQVEEGCEGSLPIDGIASNLTVRWASVVNTALAETTRVGIAKRQQQGEKDLERSREGTAPAARRKWSGKDWLGIGASWRAGEGWTGPREDQPLAKTASPTSIDNTVASPRPTAETESSLADRAVVIRRGRGKEVFLPVNATTSSSSFIMVGGVEERVVGSFEEATEQPGWRVWRGPIRRRGTVELEREELQEDEDETEGVGGGIFSASARAELTLYLLETGATHYEVADASAALFATEPETALTEATWRRWRRNLDGLNSNGFSGSDVAKVLTLCPRLLALDFEGQVAPAMDLLRKKLGMRPTDMRRVIRKAPDVLAPRPDGSTVAEAVEVLMALGFQTRHVRVEALRWPQLLAVSPSNFFQLAAFLASEEVGIKATDVGSLVRQAPWMALERIDGQMTTVVHFLRRAGVTDVERVVRAYPKILSASVRGELAPKVRFLWENVGVSEEDLPRVLQAFPLLFAIPLSRMQDVVDFLSEDLFINAKDIAKIIRAFPSLLGLERERHMKGVVTYLENLGVQNVGRFVSRLPPVLGYDVNTNLTPKMEYLVEKMGLSVYDVLTFPAFFSYPLDTVIEPRTEFLNIRGRTVTLVGLNIALQQGDSDFSRKVAKVQPRIYREFKEAYLAGREKVISGGVDVESLLSEKLLKAIGNMGGQSTSNTLSVTARATGQPPNFLEKENETKHNRPRTTIDERTL